MPWRNIKFEIGKKTNCKVVVAIFGLEYARQPTVIDVARLYKQNVV